MRPELKNGDVVLVNRLVYNAMTPKRGDIIAFKPNGRENAHYYIKRIVGYGLIRVWAVILDL